MTIRTRHQEQIRSTDSRGMIKTILWYDKPIQDAKDYGAIGDGVTDDTASIQAAIDNAYTNKTVCFLPGGIYKITSTLNLYNSTTPAGEDGVRLVGSGMANTFLYYYGSSSETPIRIIGAKGGVYDLCIKNQNGVGWLGGIEYDGKSTIGRSSHGTIRNVWIDGSSHLGDGIAIGRQGFQADMLEIDHCYIQDLPYGNAVITMNGNALSTNVIALTVSRCKWAVTQGTTTNITVYGLEADDCDLLFRHQLGDALTVTGGRSENCKRIFWNNSSGASSPLNLIGYTWASANATRAATTGAIQSGQTTLTLNTNSFVEGDVITIAGAGPASANLNTTIQAISAITASTTTCTVANAASTTVTVGAVTLQAGVSQPLLSENGAGPFTHIGCVFNGSSVYRASVSNGSQAFIGCYWPDVTITDPYGSVAGTQAFQVGWLTSINCISGSDVRMRSILAENIITTFSANDTTPSVTDNTQFVTANSNPTTVTAFDDGFNGQRIQVLVNDANTSFGTGSIKTSTGAAVAAVNGRVYTFIRFGGLWYSTGL